MTEKGSQDSVVGQRLAEAGEAVSAAVGRYLPAATGPAGTLGEAAAHALGGGKWVRPMIVRLAAQTFGLAPADVTPTACAFELLHTATLVHDDLPAIDDADLRRGRPSVHVAFDEPAALLAGDALIISAFAALADQARIAATPPAVVAPVMADVATAVQDVIAGELADIRSEGKPANAELLDFIHLHKTAALIRAAARAGAMLARAPEGGLAAAGAYGRALGLLFQVTDDLLDVTGDSERIGKPTGADAAAGKQTYPAAYGVEGARRRAKALAAEAREAAESLPALRDEWRALVALVLDREA